MEAATLGLTKVLSDEADEGGGRGAGLIMGERSLGDVGGHTIRVRHGFLWGRIPAQENNWHISLLS